MKKTVLVLRTVNEDMTSGNSYVSPAFAWPEKGYVECSDWQPTYECGKGLHGLLWGEGNSNYLDWSDNAKWLVVRVNVADLLHGEGNLTDKCKFRCGRVVYCGDRTGATQYIYKYGGAGKAIVGLVLTGGDHSVITGGYGSTITGGDYSVITGGDYSTITGGYGSTITGGDYSTITGGDHSTITGGYGSTITGGYGSTITGGYISTITGGYGSTITGGYGSVLQIAYWDSAANRKRIAIAYVGEDGIELNVAYRLNDKHEFEIAGKE